MGELPGFSRMTKEEIGDWFLANDTNALLARAERAAEPIVQVDDQGEPVMRPATFRLPPSMLEWREHAAGRDREGVRGADTDLTAKPRVGLDREDLTAAQLPQGTILDGTGPVCALADARLPPIWTGSLARARPAPTG